MSVSAKQQQANRRSLRRMLLITAAMFGFAFALVPLYNVICEITGLNGKTNSQALALNAVQTGADSARTVTVEFVANTAVGVSWEFAPVSNKLQVHPGEFQQTRFYAKNLSGRAMVGQAVPSVAPGQAAKHFQKIECFCFQQQHFKPQEAKEMPLVFRVDPALDENITTITLSYTFFEAPDAQ